MIPNLPHYNLLFVCMGNICRSPTGECIMRDLVDKAGMNTFISIDSAGTIGYHHGYPPDDRMTAHAARRGITLAGHARQFKVADFEKSDLILTMDHENYRDVVGLAPNEDAAAKVIPMVTFSTWQPAPDIVPDPYHGGETGFLRVLDILEDCCANLLGIITRNIQR